MLLQIKYRGCRRDIWLFCSLIGIAWAIPVAAWILYSRGSPHWNYVAYASIVTPLLFRFSLKGIAKSLLRRVQFHEAGIVYCELGTVNTVRFSEVVAIREAIVESSSSGGDRFFSGTIELKLEDG